jgi:hypothetical protein
VLSGHTLVAHKEHREQATGDFSVEEYLRLQALIYDVGEAPSASSAVDNDLHVRAATSPQSNGGQILVVRDDDESEWRPLLTMSSDDALTSGPVGFTKDGASMYHVFSDDHRAVPPLAAPSSRSCAWGGGWPAFSSSPPKFSTHSLDRPSS